MTMELHHSADPDDGVIDAEVVEPSTMERIKGAYALQRVRVAFRLRRYYAAEDLTDEKIHAKATERLHVRKQGKDDKLTADVARIRTQLGQAKARARHRDGEGESLSDSYEIERLSGQLDAAEARVEIRAGDGRKSTAADVPKPTAKDLSHERWIRKAKRAGATAAVGFGWLQVLASDFLIGLGASAVAVPVAWWYLAREDDDQDQEQEQVDEQPVAVEYMEAAGTPAAPVEGEPFLPPTLADAGKVSLVKRDSARVRGELDLITALVKAGIITAAQRDETHIVGVIRPAGPGWTATIELPRGMKAEVAVGKVADLASSLRIKKTRIEMKADTGEDGHEGQFVLWVANEDNPYGTGITPSPLIEAPAWDFWQQGIPLGVDARAVLQTMYLLWTSLLIGGLMGYGKTYLARLVAAAAALDPTMRIIVVTGKTGPDWAPLRHVAHRWIAGADPVTIRRVLNLMESTIGEMQDRGTELDRIYEENPEVVPEGKITPELTKKGMGLVLLLVDELQELLDGASLVQVPVEDEFAEEGRRPKTRSGKDLMVESFARYVRVTRFVGGMGVFITQRPDAKTVPTELREVCEKRGSFRVKGDRSAKMVLGDDAVGAGAAPHMLGEASKGVVVLDSGAEEGHVTLKSHVIDASGVQGDLPARPRAPHQGRHAHRRRPGVRQGSRRRGGRTPLPPGLPHRPRRRRPRPRPGRKLMSLLADHDADEYGGLTTTQLQTRLPKQAPAPPGRSAPSTARPTPTATSAPSSTPANRDRPPRSRGWSPPVGARLDPVSPPVEVGGSPVSRLPRPPPRPPTRPGQTRHRPGVATPQTTQQNGTKEHQMKDGEARFLTIGGAEVVATFPVHDMSKWSAPAAEHAASVATPSSAPPPTSTQRRAEPSPATDHPPTRGARFPAYQAAGAPPHQGGIPSWDGSTSSTTSSPGPRQRQGPPRSSEVRSACKADARTSPSGIACSPG